MPRCEDQWRRYGDSVTIVWAALLLWSCSPAAPPTPPAPPDLSSRLAQREIFTCAAGPYPVSTVRPAFEAAIHSPAEATAGAAEDVTVLEPGTPVYFEQDPPILTPSYTGEVTLRNFTVVGHVDTIRFAPSSPRTLGNPVKTTTEGGVAITRFEPVWGPRQVAEIISAAQTGYDNPDIGWGHVETQDFKYGIHLRFTSDRVAGTEALALGPSSPFHIEHLPDEDGAEAYYSSDVVNLVIPGYGDSRIDNSDQDLAQMEVTKLFYQYFQDEYHVISIMPQAIHMTASWGGFQDTVKSTVEGINYKRPDRSIAFGSGGTLQGVHVYPQNEGLENDAVAHEFAHQYAHYFDWQAIAGIERGGAAPEVHAPIWMGKQSLVGSILEGHWEIVNESGTLKLAVSESAPHRFHPLTLYAMGLLEKEGVPPVELISDQKQFDPRGNPPMAQSPKAGDPVSGSLVARSINDIVAKHRERKGPPVPAELRWATVIVSRDEPLTAAEWRYWTLYARRLGDPGASAQLDYRGYGSIEAAADRAIDVVTEILPLAAAGPPIRQPLPVDDLYFGRRDFIGIELDEPIPRRFDRSRGIPLRVVGRITRTGRTDYSWLHVFLDRFPYDAKQTIDRYVEVDSQGFDGAIPAANLPAGRYQLTIGLQTSRSPDGDVNLGPTWSTFEVVN